MSPSRILKAPQAPGIAPDVAQAVAAILAAVRARGDEALRAYTRQFDGVEVPSPVVGREEIDRAVTSLPADTRDALRWLRGRVAAFAQAQRRAITPVELDLAPGIRAGHRLLPVQAAGCYVPGGRAPLPSTAMMTIVPARIAGVARVVACAPPGPDGRIHPATMAAMAMAGADEIYCMGGVQAIGALAFGTASVRPVDLIVGPGNRYVVEAKRQVFGTVGIDMLAGPTELCVIADGTANADLVAADLVAQAEHDPDASAILLTTVETLGHAVLERVERQMTGLPTAGVIRQSWTARGEVVVVENLDDAVDRANAMAPEHVQLHVAEPEALVPRLAAYGALFTGAAGSAVFGDYGVGPSHVLPTGRAARYIGGLWVGTFLRAVSQVSLTVDGAAELAPAVERLAEIEGLPGHAAAARRRRRS